ncbi:hypothetical protein BKP42_41150 [Rhodococcus erythropolis]|uniref:hypothetical protein n=1 Tax=Rhodococcus erythropolis TaxID=1833 RepID=UPI00117A959D|nr:hypothetical protein [Rhodococcus erythropolis]PBI96434.1 hypothetical protein BKP42_41150 [Rhodococcus erythropolis]
MSKATLDGGSPVWALFNISDLLADRPEKWFRTSEITCAVDPNRRAMVRTALQLLAATGYVKTRVESRDSESAQPHGHDYWYRFVKPFTVRVTADDAETYVWEGWK